MREIRFRAWDKEKKEMLLDGLEFEYRCLELPNPLTPDRRIGFHEWEFQRFALMQYTGFTDKTGVEIYEGDVCRASYVCLACFDSDPHILTGEITKDSFGAWMFDFGHGAMAISHLIMDEGSDIEVIGNVCENPELVG